MHKIHRLAYPCLRCHECKYLKGRRQPRKMIPEESIQCVEELWRGSDGGMEEEGECLDCPIAVIGNRNQRPRPRPTAFVGAVVLGPRFRHSSSDFMTMSSWPTATVPYSPAHRYVAQWHYSQFHVRLRLWPSRWRVGRSKLLFARRIHHCHPVIRSVTSDNSISNAADGCVF